MVKKKKKKQAFNFSLYKRNSIFLLNETVTISVMGYQGAPLRSLGIPSAISIQPSSGLAYSNSLYTEISSTEGS